jgi:acetoin utilization deacetylase AcuC-like enzyme
MVTTAYVTDERYAVHTLAGHPEHAERLGTIQHRFREERLTRKLLSLDPQPAAQEDVLAVHDPGYLEQLAQTSRLSGPAMWDADTYVVPRSYEIALLAAGGVLRVVDAVMKGAAANGLAAIRPPGHHATPSDAMGFCLLNNVAIAARYAQRAYQVKRVLIVDYDVHHGNGTQDAFYGDPTVLYVSTHQSPLYPGTGLIDETGQGQGEGYTLNIPLPPGTGDAGYARVFAEIILPAARRFAPDLILVSVGFDVHWQDPLASMKLSLPGCDHLARLLIDEAASLCGGRIVFVLEGGYNLQALSHGWANVARALLGEVEIIDPLGPARGTEPTIEQLVDRVKHVHKLF